MQQVQRQATSQHRPADFRSRQPLESRLISVTHFQVYGLTASERGFSVHDSEKDRMVQCVPEELAHRLAHVKPLDGAPPKVHHDAFGCPEEVTHRVFSGHRIGTGELSLVETFSPGAAAYFVEVQPIAMAPPTRSGAAPAKTPVMGPHPLSGPVNTKPRRGPLPSTKPDPPKKQEFVVWGQGEFKQVVPVGVAFYQRHRTTEGQVKGEWIFLSRQPKEEWESPYPPNAIRSRAATADEIRYAQTLQSRAA